MIACLREFLAVFGCVGTLLLIAWMARDDHYPFRNSALSAGDEAVKPINKPIYGLCLVPGANLLAAFGPGGAIHLYNQQTGELVDRLWLPNGHVASLAASPDGQQILAGYGDGTAVLWNMGEGMVRMQKFLKDDAQTRDIAFSHNGKWVVLSAMQSDLHVWDLAAEEWLQSSITHEEACHAVRFTSDDRQLISAGSDGTIRFWNFHTGEEVLRLTGHTRMVFDLDLSPDEQCLVSCSLDKTIRAWDVPSGRELWQVKANSVINRPVAFSPEGRLLATGGKDSHIYLRERETGEAIAILAGHTSGIRDLTFSPEGKTLYSCSLDGTIRCWDVETRSEQWTTRWESR